MERRTVAGVPLVLFEGLDLPGIVHGVTTRAGGVSEGPFATLNLGLRGGDDVERVLVNRGRASRAVGVALDSWVCGRQVHRANVATVDAGDRGRGARDPETAIPDTDALVTATRGVTLVTLAADCPLVGVVDPGVPAVGLAHASWRTTVAGLVSLMVGRMVSAFGCRPARMRAGIAPSAGPCCYEVGEEVREAARQVGPVCRQAGRAERFFPVRDGRLHMDLWAANIAQLVEAGVPPEAVDVAGVCSICHPDQFFSYRAMGSPVGHIGFLLGLR